MKRRLTRLLLLLGVSAYVAVRILTGAIDTGLDAPHRGLGPGESVVVDIPPGTSAARVAELLAERRVVASPNWFRWYLWWTGRAGRIQAGEYRFDGGRSVRQVADDLVAGRVALRRVTIPEGSTRWQVAGALAGAGFGTPQEALLATGRTGRVRDLAPEARSLEGYLFPDTYLAPRTAGAEELVEMMVDRFRDAWNEHRQRRAQETGLTANEIVILASLVEAETTLEEERPLVAAVFLNRLERQMLLQCDPTLLYALRLAGRTDRNIRRSDFDHDSPYNTYRYPGLPPGPIANPGEASLDAALFPADTDYLYFVGRNDGSHAFARTLREHNRNVNRFQRSGR